MNVLPKTSHALCVYAIALVCICLACSHARASEVVVHSTAGSFEDVKSRVVFAIEERGLVLNYTARVGAMLDRTGGDIGSSHPIYSRAEVLEFCSAAISRATMEADPHNIAHCPYSIAVYSLAREQKRVYVSYRKLAAGTRRDASRIALLKVERLLADIVREALD